MSTGRIQLGQRVWVADPAVPQRRTFGHIASMPEAYLNGHTSFVVMLEGGTPTAITCSTGRQGSQWDYASEVGASP